MSEIETLKAEVQRTKLENAKLMSRMDDLNNRLKQLEGLNNNVAYQLDCIAKQHRKRDVKNDSNIIKRDKQQIDSAWNMLKNLGK